MSKAMIAMSGGVDSSVAAYLTKKQGNECIGATMKLLFEDMATQTDGKSCCSMEDVMDAKSVARKLGFQHYTFNFVNDFTETVIKRFANAYAQGVTPNPCIDCNYYLKFGKLLRRAHELCCEYVVTGHYARINEGSNGRMHLLKAVDSGKDQSYFLYNMTQEMLRHTRFPLGDLPKTKVREIASGLKLITAKKCDSQDICFVKKGRYTDFLTARTPDAFSPGDFINQQGAVLGRHNGIAGYTIGQRRGIGISFTEPLYVTKISARKNSITLGREDDLYCSTLKATNVNFVSVERLQKPVRVTAKIRSAQQEQLVWAEQISLDEISVAFDFPQRAVTPGQAVVLYDGEYVLCGGTISMSY